jgi:hypothetical protein
MIDVWIASGGIKQEPYWYSAIPIQGYGRQDCSTRAPVGPRKGEYPFSRRQVVGQDIRGSVGAVPKHRFSCRSAGWRERVQIPRRSSGGGR